MDRKTSLFDSHVELGARMVDFAGYLMPLHYGSQIEEHHAVRQSAGVFDVSHMCVVDIDGADSETFLRKLLANDVARLKANQALYSCMLTPSGGVIDDLIVYRRPASGFRLVVNAGTRDKDLAWIRSHLAGSDVSVAERVDLSILAVQGPDARDRVASSLNCPEIKTELKRFYALENDGFFVGRTGYTGEDGVEIILENTAAEALWSQLQDADVKPCGLGSRDSLRLEAGLNLYGQDMDESTLPWVANLGWTVNLADPERDFLGREALLQAQSAGVTSELVGCVLLERGVMRHGQIVSSSAGNGVVTSGGFSPTLNCSIAMVRLPLAAEPALEVQIRNKQLAAKKVLPPFVKSGAATFEL